MKTPLVHIGIVLATDLRDSDTASAYEQTSGCLQNVLREQFSRFRWQVDFVNRNQYAPRGAIDPLPLLMFGVQEKIGHHWDYVLVVVPNALQPHKRVHTVGIPSSALETAVLSTADLDEKSDEFCDQLVALALHLLGHLWGLEHHTTGPMRPPEDLRQLQLSHFPNFQQSIAADRLDEVADQRLEEQTKHWNRPAFYWRAFWADPKSILIDIVGYSPWKLPLQAGRLTAATAVTILILLLTAETWEVGVHFSLPLLVGGTIVALIMATAFIFAGQNLGQIPRTMDWHEQLTRTRIVIFGTVLLGMITLWLLLFGASFFIGWLLPDEVLAAWIRESSLSTQQLARHAAFMALLGVLAGALGGNLEDEGAIKAKLFFDEET
jgi:predicted Zn-dependent protease